MESDDLRKALDKGSSLAKETKNPRAIMFAELLQDLYSGYYKYYPVEELKKGIKLIKTDKAFKPPMGMKDNLPKTLEETQTMFKLLFWEDIILNRFQLYAFAKSLCEAIAKYAPSKHNNNNAIQEYIHFISPLIQIVNLGVENYKSFTVNSIDQKTTKHIPVPNIKFLIEKFSEDIKTVEKVKQALPGSADEKAKLIELIASFDIREYQKHIFKGILEDFEITKKGTTTNQSLRYKSEILWNLFKHTHKHLYYEKGTAGADVRSMRTKVLLSIISPD